MRRILATFLGMLSLCAFAAVEADGAESNGDAYAFPVPGLDFGVEVDGKAPDLSTPQAAMEFFLAETDEERYRRAAQVLNLSRLPEGLSSDQAASLAKRLDYILESTIEIDWSSLPDRSDGAVDDPRQTGRPEPRRSITLDSVDLNGRGIPINLQRFVDPEGRTAWLISPHSVAEIDALYDEHGPGLLLRWMPDDIRSWAIGDSILWIWIALPGLALLSVMIGWPLSSYVLRLLHRRPNSWLARVTENIGLPLALTLVLLIFNLVDTALLNPVGAVSRYVEGTAGILLYVVVIWLVIQVLWGLGEAFSTRYYASLNDPDHVQARRARTRIAVGRRLVIGFAIVAGIGVVLVQFQVVDALGLSLLASAGALTVVLSIAARPLLENMLSGFQIAVTEPIRIGDSILFDGKWGTVEEIAFTYILVLTWDQRRLVIPHTKLLNEHFQNLSKKNEFTKWTVHLRVDHMMDIDALRERYLELVEADERWEGDDKRLEVYDLSDEALDVRVLACARSPGDAWSLHCHLREELIKFLQGFEEGRYMVRRRAVLESAPGEGLRSGGEDDDEHAQDGGSAPKPNKGRHPAAGDGGDQRSAETDAEGR